MLGRSKDRASWVEPDGIGGARRSHLAGQELETSSGQSLMNMGVELIAKVLTNLRGKKEKDRSPDTFCNGILT